MTVCPSCGNEIPAGANFCDHCGQGTYGEAPIVYEVKDPSISPLYELHFGQYIKTAWRTFLQYPLGFLGFGMIFVVVMEILRFVQEKIPAIAILPFAALTPLYVGLYIVSTKLLQQHTCRFSDFFAGFHYYRPLIILGSIPVIIIWLNYFFKIHAWLFLYGLLASLFFAMLFWVLFCFTPLLIIDRRLGLWQAMNLSRKTVQRRPLKIIVYFFLVWLIFIFIAGAVAEIMGLFFPAMPDLARYPIALLGTGLVALPLFSAALTAAYADIFGLQSKEY